MDLQTRKLNTIGYIIGLQDDKAFSKIESAILKSINHKPRPLTAEMVVDRAMLSNEDYKAGRVKTQKELEKESENW